MSIRRRPCTLSVAPTAARSPVRNRAWRLRRWPWFLSRQPLSSGAARRVATSKRRRGRARGMRPVRRPRGTSRWVAQLRGGRSRAIRPLLRYRPADGHPGGGDLDTTGSYAFAELDLAAVTRTRVYDRANLGSSGPAPRPRQLSDLVADLEGWIDASGETGPFVLVAPPEAGTSPPATPRSTPNRSRGWYSSTWGRHCSTHRRKSSMRHDQTTPRTPRNVTTCRSRRMPGPPAGSSETSR